MSIVAWDGKTLAADSMAINCGLKLRTQKIYNYTDHNRISLNKEHFIAAFVGTESHGKELLAWYLDGHLVDDYPDFQKTPDWTRLIILRKTNRDINECVTFEQTAFPLLAQAPFDAWGSGRDFALGAMAMGADAVEAAEIANRFSDSCGYEVMSFTMRDEKG